MAFAGRYLWWAVVLFAVSLVIFLASRSAPHLHAGGPPSPIKDITELLTALGTVIGGIIALLGIIQKMRGGSSTEPKPPTETLEDYREPRDREVAGRRRQEDDHDDRYERAPRESYRGTRDREVVGRTRERIVPDKHDDRYEWVQKIRFVGYDEANGDEVWKIVEETRQRIR